MTLKEFTDWIQGIKLVKDLLTPATPDKPRKPRKSKDNPAK